MKTMISDKEKGQAMIEYVLATMFIGLSVLGTHFLFRYALERYYLKIIEILSSFTP